MLKVNLIFFTYVVDYMQKKEKRSIKKQETNVRYVNDDRRRSLSHNWQMENQERLAHVQHNVGWSRFKRDN